MKKLQRFEYYLQYLTRYGRNITDISPQSRRNIRNFSKNDFFAILHYDIAILNLSPQYPQYPQYRRNLKHWILDK